MMILKFTGQNEGIKFHHLQLHSDWSTSHDGWNGNNNMDHFTEPQQWL